MLHILFLILKIIGITLLVILGIALILVGVVLFVPVRYRIKAETTDGMKDLRVEAKASWILHLASAFATYQNGELDWQLRIGWKKFKADDEEVEFGDVENEDEDVKPVGNEDADTESTKSDEEDAVTEETAEQGNSANKSEKASKKSTTKKKQTKSKKKEKWIEKIKCTIKDFCDKIKNIKEYLMDELHIQAFMRLKKELVVFIKRIKPTKIKGYLRFGFEDPYNTGRVLAVLSALYPFYGEYFEVYPEFEREILEADLYMKGRVHIIHLVIAICNLYFDDNIKTAYKNFKTLKG